MGSARKATSFSSASTEREPLKALLEKAWGYQGGTIRTRAAFVALAVGTIAVGLGVHRRGDILGAALRDMLGDALWATMIAWWVAALVPRASLRTRAIAALAICFAVELSQLYHAPALDALRRTTAGHLVLGSGFDPRDFVSYALGVLAAALLERIVRKRGRSDQLGRQLDVDGPDPGGRFMT